MNNSDKKFALTQKIILYALPTLAVAGVTIPLIFGQSNLSLLGSYLAVPMFVAPIIFLKLRQKPYKPINSGQSLFLALLIVYSLCFTISIFLLYTFEVRPVAYYAIITAMAATILFEILLYNNLSQKKEIIILLQIMMLSLNIIWGVSLKYFYFIGRTDALGHAWFIDNLIKYGHLTDVFEIYKPFPLWHILCCSLSEILGLSIPAHKIMFFTNGLIFSFLIPLVYLVSLRLFKNKSFALLSSLFVSFSSGFIYCGMYSIARSVVSFLGVMLILLLLDRANTKKIQLSIFVTFIIIMYHSVSILFIMLLLLVICAFQKFYGVEKEQKFLTANYLILTFTMIIIHWIYYAEELFQALIKNIITPPEVGIFTKTMIYVPFCNLFNYLQYSPLLFFVIIGVLWVLKSKKSSGFAKIFGIVGLLAVVVSFHGPLLLLKKLALNFNLARFEEYTFPFISIIGAVGFAISYHKARKHLKILIVLLFAIMCFLAISNDFTASDNPLVKRPLYTYYLTDEEVTAFNHVGVFTDGYLMSDYITCRYLMYSLYEAKYHPLEVDKQNMDFLRSGNNDIILIRGQELDKRPLHLYSSENDKFKLKPAWGANLDCYYHDLPLWNSLEGYNKIYTSGGVVGYN